MIVLIQRKTFVAVADTPCEQALISVQSNQCISIKIKFSLKLLVSEDTEILFGTATKYVFTTILIRCFNGNQRVVDS